MRATTRAIELAIRKPQTVGPATVATPGEVIPEEDPIPEAEDIPAGLAIPGAAATREEAEAVPTTDATSKMTRGLWI